VPRGPARPGKAKPVRKPLAALTRVPLNHGQRPGLVKTDRPKAAPPRRHTALMKRVRA